MRAAAVGMFDGVHLGHQAMVRQVCAYASEHGMSAAVFTFNRHPMEIVAPERAPLLLTTVPQRLQLLCEAGADEAISLDFDQEMRMLSAKQFIEMLKRDYDVGALILGFNHRFGHDRISDFEQYRRIGQEAGVDIVRSEAAVEARLSDGSDALVSSTAIRQAVADGDVADAAIMLGRSYSISGCIGHGKRIGRSIGYPTANLLPDSVRQLVPADGAYATIIDIHGPEALSFPSMTNIGVRPTIAGDKSHCRTIETHLIGYEGNLYGAKATLRFAARLRPEQRFPSLEALKSQLENDKDLTISILDKYDKD